jgi:arsenite methyltransferase
VGCIAGALSKGEYGAGLAAAGFEEVSVEFTHEVADGLHGAIVRAVKRNPPTATALPVIQPAARAGCC